MKITSSKKIEIVFIILVTSALLQQIESFERKMLKFECTVISRYITNATCKSTPVVPTGSKLTINLDVAEPLDKLLVIIFQIYKEK
jgi:hypothetical protein